MRIRIFLALLPTLQFLLAASVRAEFIPIVNVNVNQIGTKFEYVYTVSNPENSGLEIESFSLFVAENAILENIASPIGWSVFYSAGYELIAWNANDFDWYIIPGSDAIFSFVSEMPPAFSLYEINGLHPDDPSFDEVARGIIRGPGTTVIPEPSAFLQTGIGILGLTGFGWWHRRRKQSQASAE